MIFRCKVFCSFTLQVFHAWEAAVQYIIMVPTRNVYHIVPQSRIPFEGPLEEKLSRGGFLVLFSNAKPSTQYP